MNDRHAHFLIAVGDLCAAAALGGLEITVVRDDGTTANGLPGSIRQADGGDEVDHSGYARTFTVDGALVNLDEIVVCTIRAPVLGI